LQCCQLSSVDQTSRPASTGVPWAKTASAIVEAYREAALSPARPAATLSRDAVARERELTGTFDAAVQKLIAERENGKRTYEALKAEVGWGQSLVGPRGKLPENLKRALLALSARPALSEPAGPVVVSLYALWAP
jgi:hypothetical protein